MQKAPPYPISGVRAMKNLKQAVTAAAIVLVGLALIVGSDAGDAKKKKKKKDATPKLVAARPEEVPKLIETLKSSTAAAKDRAVAAERIGLRGMVNYMDVEPAVPPLQKALTDREALVRKAAATALGNIHPEAKDTVPLLTGVVKNDKAMDVKLAAVVALGQFGGEARSAVPALRELAGKFDNKKSSQFQTVQAAIKNITGKKKK
jgi:HEAT repeat protein